MGRVLNISGQDDKVTGGTALAENYLGHRKSHRWPVEMLMKIDAGALKHEFASIAKEIMRELKPKKNLTA